MPSYSRPSPNAVIHDWLSHTQVGPETERHASSPKEKRGSQVKHRQHRLRDGEKHLQPRGSVRQRTEGTDDNRTLGEAGNLHSPASFEHDTHQLAQRLGFRTPFRTLDSNQRQVHGKEKSTGKRKRSLSPSSSYLQPRDRRRISAEAEDRERLISSRFARRAAGPDRSIAKSPCHLPGSSTAALNFSKAPAKPYERKSRHKTREDRYTLKEASKVPKQNPNETESPVRKKGKRKRKEKSGSALMHDFTARNVAFSRLTLPSAPVVGIFSKGRASSPIKRMGLPDLAFSEVSFLKSGREKPESLHEPLRRSLGRSNGAFAHDDAVISRYFTSNKDCLPHRPGRELDLSTFSKQCGHRREGVQFLKERSPIKEKTVLPLLELPETPFLGFGSSGFSISSPAKLCTPLKTTHRTTRSPVHLTSPTRSTTYYTWSRSGALSQDSFPLDYTSKPSPRSGLNNECQPYCAPAGHAHAVMCEDIQVEDSSGHDDAPRRSEALSLGVDDQARILDIGHEPSQVQQPIRIRRRSKELSNERETDDNGKTLENVCNEEFSAKSSTKTSLAEKTLVASLDMPLVSNNPSLKSTASLKSFDVALDKLIRQCTETPSRQITTSRHETAIHSSAKDKEPKDQASGQAGTPGHDFQDSSVLTVYPTFAFDPSSPPSASTMRPPNLSNQSRTSLGSPSSMAWLSRDPRPYEYGTHRVPLSKVPVAKSCVMKQSSTPRKDSWDGCDNMYERQEMHRNNLSNGNVGNMRGYTSVKTLRSEEFVIPEGHFTRPYHGLSPYRRREKMGFQQPGEHGSGSENPLNEYSETLQGVRYRYISSPAFRDLAANFGEEEEGDPQVHEEYSHGEAFDAADDARLDLGQRCPQYRFDMFKRPEDLATQNHPLFAPDVRANPLPWSLATPSHTPQSRHGFSKSSDRLCPDQDEEDHFSGFWKPNLLY